jgi:hypothetical protein
MEYLALGALGLLAFYYLENSKAPTNGAQMNSSVAPLPGDGMHTEVTEYKDPVPRFDNDFFNLNEMGMAYGIEKPTLLNVTNLNEAYKPWSAPSQEETRSIPVFMGNQAVQHAYLEAYGAPFYFNKNGEIPLSSNQQNNPNVEIPGESSIQFDPNSSLSYYPRVYVDQGEERRKPTGEYRDGFLQAFQPDEGMEMLRIQDEGRLNRDYNPWGPGGAYQRVFTRNQEELSRIRGVDRSTILAPVYSGVS